MKHKTPIPKEYGDEINTKDILKLQKDGHTFHCVMRILTGDGECECGKTNFIPGNISTGMYLGKCLVCLSPDNSEHREWCRNKQV